MSAAGTRLKPHLPSVDEVLRSGPALAAIAQHGRAAALSAVRDALAALRAAGDHDRPAEQVAEAAVARMEAAAKPSLRAVYNLTGTVLHTNLGRALLAEAAVEAATEAMRRAVCLEYDLAAGKRGERDDHLRGLLCELSGAADATAVNNNAAAVLLALNSLGKGREAIVSRGELIEIGGSFRLPEIMARAGVRLVEVGTTNRTHLRDYAEALGPRTGLILKVHSSNYRIEGFTSSVPAGELALLARERGVPLLHDLGSGTLVDLVPYVLAREPTVAEAVADGADLVTFSGDKLLGGPQAGFIVGSREALARCNRNPMKRALRLDKIRVAALEATLRLYRDPDRLAERLPTLRLLARPEAEIRALAERLAPAVARALGSAFRVEAVRVESEIGSGALPQQSLPSAALSLRPATDKASGRRLQRLAAALRGLPVPVIGRIAEGALLLDLRCLEDEAAFAANLTALAPTEAGDGLV